MLHQAKSTQFKLASDVGIAAEFSIRVIPVTPHTGVTIINTAFGSSSVILFYRDNRVLPSDRFLAFIFSSINQINDGNITLNANSSGVSTTNNSKISIILLTNFVHC